MNDSLASGVRNGLGAAAPHAAQSGAPASLVLAQVTDGLARATAEGLGTASHTPLIGERAAAPNNGGGVGQAAELTLAGTVIRVCV